MSLSEKIKANAKKSNNWLHSAKERKANEHWLDISFKISMKILRFLREAEMTQKDLAQKLGFSPQYLSKVLKGKENLTIETISKIQNTINIKLIQVPEFSLSEEYEPILSKSSSTSFKVGEANLFLNQELSVESEKLDEILVSGDTQYAMAA